MGYWIVNAKVEQPMVIDLLADILLFYPYAKDYETQLLQDVLF
jgi:hypothetical protein